MPAVYIKDGEDPELALKRFKRQCEKGGILTECRRREFREKPTAARKRKAMAAVKRWKKRLAREEMRILRRRVRRVRINDDKE